jgi:hypothetical protein
MPSRKLSSVAFFFFKPMGKLGGSSANLLNPQNHQELGEDVK